MLKTVKQACKFNPIIRDCRMSEGVEKLSDMISGESDGRKFFERNSEFSAGLSDIQISIKNVIMKSH